MALPVPSLPLEILLYLHPFTTCVCSFVANKCMCPNDVACNKNISLCCLQLSYVNPNPHISDQKFQMYIFQLSIMGAKNSQAHMLPTRGILMAKPMGNTILLFGSQGGHLSSMSISLILCDTWKTCQMHIHQWNVHKSNKLCPS